MHDIYTIYHKSFGCSPKTGYHSDNGWKLSLEIITKFFSSSCTRLSSNKKYLKLVVYSNKDSTKMKLPTEIRSYTKCNLKVKV